jgi:hypothetical protein
VSALTYLSFALEVLLLLTVPGWLWLRRAGVDPLISLYAGPGAGALAGGAIVAVGVILPWSVGTTCIAGAVVMVASAVYCALTAPRPLAPERGELVGLAVFVVAFLSMAAFAAVPSRPYGIWGVDSVGPGRVDTPRWPGLPSDNSLPFRTGQVALYKQGGAEIRDQYAVGWWLSDRTPLTGLDFAFASAALGVHVSSVNLEDMPSTAVPMVIEDSGGFWAYQIVAMFLNLAIILGVYLLARVWRSRRVAAVAALVAALMPGLFLNGIYTWPKQAVAYFVLIGAACALRRRPVLAGACAGLGYLTHPAGLMWIPSIALVLLLDADLRTRLWGTLLRFLAPLAVLVAPWEFFTSQVMHATSRWTTSPLSYVMTDPTALGSQLKIAWHVFLSRGILLAVWTRLQSTAGSLVPTDLGSTPAAVPHAGFGPQIMVFWSAAHGFSVWGMAGLVLFPFAVVHVARAWLRFRGLLLWFVLPAVIFAELANGFAYPFANQSMFALVGVIAVAAASGLLEARWRTRMAVLAAIAFELLTMVYGGLYRPFDVSTSDAVVLTVIAAAGQLVLLAALASVLDLLPVRFSSSAIPGASPVNTQG